jgi:5-formyltetrahydrofolate cyclo-ligase
VADSSDRADAKAGVRRQVAAALARLSPDRCRAAGIAAARNLQTLPAVTEAGTVMAFLSLATEMDTWPVIRWAWDGGKGVAIPRVGTEPAGGRGRGAVRTMAPVLLEPAEVACAAAHPAVRPGAFGILTAPEAPVVPPEEIDVVLVPCVAVDRRGNRLGRGGGYYDRFLARPEVRAVRIALALREQVLDTVPAGEGDEPMDTIVTEDEVLRFNRPGAGPAAPENPTGEE